MDAWGALVVLILLVGIGAASSRVMASKGRSEMVGFALGFFLGLIGLVICACMSKTMEKRVEESVELDAAMRRMRGDR